MMPAEITAHLHPAAMQVAREGVVLVGLSGGRDSVALLLLLLEQGCKEVVACHVNHGIRGEEADADEQFCVVLCKRLGVQMVCKHADVPALAQSTKQSLETAARQVRREFFLQVAQEYGATAIALAHHADDQAETVLFRLGRGAAGTRGMKAVDAWQGKLLIRPLLQLTRADITAWLQARGETWRDDSTNAVADVARNRIRHEVVPALNRALGRDVVPVLCRSARLQQETLEALEAAIQALPVLDPQGRLYLPFVLQQPPALQKAIVHRYLQAAGVPQISETMVQSVVAMLPAEAEPARMCLPGGLMAIRRQKRLCIRTPQ